MKRLKCMVFLAPPIAILAIACGLASPVMGYLKLHPDNPHYYQETSTGKAVLLPGYGGPAPTSYGIDYVAQINNDASHGMIYGRVWHLLPWEYGNAIWPWPRSSTPGACDGLGNKYDLNSWNSTYWTRLKDALNRMNNAGQYGEVFLFEGCGMEQADRRWHNHPWASDNNINSQETTSCTSSGTPDFYNYSSKPNLHYQQERYVNKMIDETIAYPNVIYEIENEHDSGNEPAWTNHWSQFVKNRIAANYPSSPRLISNTSDFNTCFNDSNVDIVNYHSDSMDTNQYNTFLEGNWYKNKAMCVDELANGQTSYDSLRKVCWTIVASGGHFHEEDPETSAQPYDIAANIISFLSNSGWDFAHAAPNKGLITSGGGYCMAETGVEYMCYFTSGGSKTVNLAAGSYISKWWNPRSGGLSSSTNFFHGGGGKSFTTPDSNDWVLYICQPSSDTQAPSVPTNVQATALSATSVRVTWTASTDNVGVAGYNIYRNGSQVGTSITTSYTDTGLQGITTYSYTVSAYDAAGNYSAQSSPPVTATTPAMPTFCSIDLGDTDTNNFLSRLTNGDGDTTSANVGGLNCRQPMDTGDQYFYLAIDDGYLYNESGTTRYVEVCYYDDQSTSVYMQPQYDAVGDGVGNIYRSASSVYFTNTGKWKTVTWTLTECKFANRQNAGADFRIYVGAYTVKIDSVRVSTVSFTTYNSVERDLGSSEVYRGLSHPQPSDGDTVTATTGGRECRKCSASGDNYMYFNVSDAIIYSGSPATVYLKVAYYDSAGGSITPQYDSTSGIYTNATTLNFTGTNTWKEGTWTLSNAKFANQQDGSADLRLSVGTSQNVYIDQVIASKTPFESDTQPPSVPTNVVAAAQSSTSIQVTWTASTDNFGVSGYEIYRNAGQVGTSGSTSYTDTGLTPLTTYSYTVSAYDGANNNSAQSSPPATATTQTGDTQAPSVPTGVAATAQSGTSIQVSWTASTDNVGVTGYKIYRNASQVGTSATTNYTDTGLTPSTTYSYTVSAYDAANNNSAQSSPAVTAKTMSTLTVTNLVPSNYQVTNFNVGSTIFIDRTYTISLMPTKYQGYQGIRTANNDKDNASLDFHFTISDPAEIYICLVDGLSPTTSLLTGFVDTGDNITTNDPSPNYNVFHKVYPAGVVSLGPKPGAGNGASMFWVMMAMVNDTTPPSVPTNVTATAQSSTSILVAWTASTDNVGVTGYKVYRNGSQVGTSATTSYTDTGLTASTTYSYTVSAYDGVNNNSVQSSPPATGTTLAPDIQPPSVPTGVQATALSSTSIQVSWTASTDNRGVAGYKVCRNASQVGTSATTSYTDTGLSPSTTYSYTVSAYDAGGNNSALSSPAATATTPAAPSLNVIYASQDSYTYASAPTTNYDGQGNKMSKTGGNETEYNPFWLFTCGSSTAQSAKLRVYQTLSNNNGGTSHWVGGTQTFDENTLTMNNRPTSFPTSLPGLSISGSTVTWYELDITSFYNAHLNSAVCITSYVDNNFGSNGIMFEDREGSRGTGNFPRIVVCNVSAPSNATATPSTICSGSSSTLTYSGGSGDVLKWYSGSCGGTYAGSGQSLSVIPGATTTYYCRWEGTSCNPSTCASVTVTVNALPGTPTSPTATPSTVCSGGSSTLSATVGGGCTAYWFTSGCATSGEIGAGSPSVSPGSTTIYYVRAKNNTTGCWSASCANVTVTVGDTELPSIPTDVAAQGVSPSVVKVTWTGSSDNCQLTGYKVYRNGSQVGTSALTSYTDTGLAACTTYSYTVSAYDAAGNESYQSSPVATATTFTAISIEAAKGLPNTSQVGLVSKIVIAIYDDSFYIEEVDRNAGIKVVPVEMPSGLGVGDTVDIGGVMQTGTNGERQIGNATATLGGA